MEIQQDSVIPHHMNTAHISLIPKPNKDHTQCSNYRPISLINVDIKIISKTLALRLELAISTLIHTDQTGFIKGRKSSDNLRRLFNLISMVKDNPVQSRIPFLIATLDAEKAFDKVEWSFLFATLKKFDFPLIFINWIKIFYNCPKASIITNSLVSEPFQLQRGTRQGCPISPMLFALFIEPLAASIRQCDGISGVQSRSYKHKISLYADDILLYITKPSTSLPLVYQLIASYGKVSGYTINWSKSEILPISADMKWNAEELNLPFRVPSKSITYLGIHISANPKDLFKLNHSPLLQEIIDSLERWNNLPLSLIGRIASIKMNILPKVNYLFAMTPVTPPSEWFASLNTTITKFYWKKKRPRISLASLQRPKKYGGLGAPNFLLYFLAHQLLYVYQWTRNDGPSWLDIENTLSQKLNVQNLLFINKSVKKLPCMKNSTIYTTLSAWWRVNEMYKFNFSVSNHTPLWNNPMFLMDNKPLTFPSWKKKGITELGHLFNKGQFMSFDQIQKIYNIPQSCTFEYIQLKGILKEYVDFRGFNKLDAMVYDKLCQLKPKKMLSQIYKMLQSVDEAIVFPIHKWAKDLNSPPTVLHWQDIGNNVFSMSCNTKLQMIQYKVLHRIHITKHQMYRMGISKSNVCSYCSGSIDNYFHALWSCPHIHTYWTEVIKQLSGILQCKIPLCPNSSLLGDITSLEVNKKYKPFILIALTIAKKAILMNWKHRTKVNINQWLELLTNHSDLEKLTASLQHKMTTYYNIWSPWLEYLKH